VKIEVRWRCPAGCLRWGGDALRRRHRLLATLVLLASAFWVCFAAPALAQSEVIGTWTGTETAQPSNETYNVTLQITQLVVDQDAGTVRYSGLCSAANCTPPRPFDCTDTLTLTSMSPPTYTFQEETELDTTGTCYPIFKTRTVRQIGPTSLSSGLTDTSLTGPGTQMGTLTRTGGPDGGCVPAACHHYRVEMKAWIPFGQIVDPLAPRTGGYLGFLGTPFASPADQCFHPSFIDSLNTSVLSTYNGNGHAGYDGAYKVLDVAEFDSDGSTIYNFRGPNSDKGVGNPDGQPNFGQTERLLDYQGPFGHVQCVAKKTTVTHSVFSSWSGGRFSLGINASNPLLLVAPGIQADLDGTVHADGGISWSIKTGEFPSYGLRFYADGVPCAAGHACRALETSIVNDASCMTQSVENGVTGPLGIGSATRIFAGLFYVNNAVSGATTLDESNVMVRPNPSVYCQGGGSSPSSASATAVYIGDNGLAGISKAQGEAKPAGSSGIMVAESNNGTTPSSVLMSLGAAQRRGVIAFARPPGGVWIYGMLRKKFVIAVSGRRRVMAILQTVRASRRRVLRYLLPAGPTTIAPLANGGPRIRVGPGVLRPQSVLSPPRTRVTITVKTRTRMVLFFRVRSRFPLAGTYVLLGTRRALAARNGRVVVRGRRVGTIRYCSVDVLGDVETPHRIR
jgi:hypothetical protein